MVVEADPRLTVIHNLVGLPPNPIISTINTQHKQSSLRISSPSQIYLHFELLLIVVTFVSLPFSPMGSDWLLRPNLSPALDHHACQVFENNTASTGSGWFGVHKLRLLWGAVSRRNLNGRIRSEAEEKVYSWLYAIARSDQDIVFEYVNSTERGLSFKEAARRIKEKGPNIPFDHTIGTWWQILWNALFHPFHIILLVLSVFSYFSGDNGNGAIMLAVVVISVSMRFYQDHTSSKAAMKLNELLKSPTKVQRCAGIVEQTELIVQIDQREIVPGDIVIFGPGDMFPGDVRLIASKDLIVSQSSLIGESGTVEKIADIREQMSTPLLELKNICFMGTSVVSGSGTGLVVSTGLKTYMSTLFSAIGQYKPVDEFEIGIRNISYVLISLMLLVIPIIAIPDYYSSKNLSESILFSVSVAVALTPQMLPLIVNTNLAKGALTMAKEQCIVKTLVAIQNMGAMNILCIDKTGTLTIDQVILVNHLDSWGFQQEKVLRFAFLNSFFKAELKNPIDEAILGYVYTSAYRFEPSKWKKIGEISFDFTRRRASVILETELRGQNHIVKHNANSQKIVVTKGALEEVLKICVSKEHSNEGIISVLSSEDRRRILSMGQALGNDGLRVLGLAMKTMKKVNCTGEMVGDESYESNMTFLGILSLYDPPKDSAKQALHQLADKGVKAKLLTGDSLHLAIRVCEEVGIRTNHVITGPDLEQLDEATFHETVEKATIFARLTPAQKLHVVQSLQKAGKHVVGYLGDGINDSLALDAADVGISVDSGASVAKDVADIILLEKDLNVLAAGVERGRVIYGNTMKYIKMSVVANIGSIVSLLVATFCLPFEPLTPRQLLTQNFLYNLGQIAVPWDNMEEEYTNTPRRWSSKGLAMFMLWNGPVCSICDLANFVLLWYYYGAHTLSSSEFFRAAWFVEGLLVQALIIHLIRTEKIPFIHEFAAWPVTCSTILVSAIGISFLYTPIGSVMGLKPLPSSYYGFLVLLLFGFFFLGHIIKRAYITVFNQWL